VLPSVVSDHVTGTVLYLGIIMRLW